jgi:hypothetical protein
MYLVEIEAGREQLYQSVDALASAIRRGDVGPQSRIFHRASSSWVSITVHPEYRRAVADQVTAPLPPLARNQWTFFGLEPRGREFDEEPVSRPSPPRASADADAERRGWRAMLGRVLRRYSPST